jgi:hypothetical protein
MNRLYIAIVGLFILVSCGRLEKKEFKLDEVELEDCIEERKMLFLPTGVCAATPFLIKIITSRLV